MKTTPILVPIALTLSAIIWLGYQHRTLADLEAQITRFETHLAKSHPATSSQPRLRDIKTALDGQPVNWMLVARELAHNPGGYGIFKANRRIEEHLASLNADELIAALDTLIGENYLDLTGQPDRTPEELRAWLESQIQVPAKR